MRRPKPSLAVSFSRRESRLTARSLSETPAYRTEALVALCARQGQDREAGDLYQKVLALDPCRESAARELMRLALCGGDRATAVAHYRHLEEVLRRELGIRPGEETRRLYDEARAEGQN